MPYHRFFYSGNFFTVIPLDFVSLRPVPNFKGGRLIHC